MKQSLFFYLFLSAATLCAQDRALDKSFSIYAGFSPYHTPVAEAISFNDPGIQREVRHNPFVFGAEYARPWRGKWHYFLSVQGALNYMQGITTLTPPQTLPPNITRIETQEDILAATQIAVGGGLQLQLLQWEWLALRAQLGAMAAYVHNSGKYGGIDLLVEDASGELEWQSGGTVKHEVSRQWIPIGRMGAGVDIAPVFAKRFRLGIDVLYLVSPRFISGSWTRNYPTSNFLLTNGMYESNWKNWVLACRLAYYW